MLVLKEATMCQRIVCSVCGQQETALTDKNGMAECLNCKFKKEERSEKALKCPNDESTLTLAIVDDCIVYGCLVCNGLWIPSKDNQSTETEENATEEEG
jgi:hypothetical protein